MGISTLQTVKRLEIIINSLELKQVIKILNQVGITGYSIIHNLSGMGDRGRISNDLEPDTSGNVYVLSICDREQEEEFVQQIQPLLKKYGGVCIVSDAKSVIH